MKEKHSERKQYFLQHKGNHSNNKEAYTDRPKSRRRKVDFTAVFADITRRGALPEEASIHTAEMTTIIFAMREIQKKREHEMSNLYRITEFYAGHREKQRKPSNIKSDMTY